MNMKTMMFYLVENRHIGNRELLIEGVRDIAGNGFESILLQIRDTAFQMDDPEVIRSVEIVTAEAHRLGVKLVLTFVTTNCRPWAASFFKQHPDEGDFYVRRAEGEIRDGKLSATVACHMLTGDSRIGHIDRVVAAFRRADNGLTRLEPFDAAFTVERQTWQDDATDWHSDPSITLRVTGMSAASPTAPWRSMWRSRCSSRTTNRRR